MKVLNLMTLALFTLTLTGCGGCTPIKPGQNGQSDGLVDVQGKTPDSVVCIVLEPTGKPDIDARTLVMVDKVLKAYRSQEAASNRIILARVGDPPLIESMTGPDFKDSYPDGIKGLMQKQGGNSRIYHTVAEAICEAKPFLGSHRAALFIFSPMKDAHEKGPNPGGRMRREIVEFGVAGGSVAFYGVERTEAPQLRADMKGIVKHHVVTTDADVKWPLPEWK